LTEKVHFCYTQVHIWNRSYSYLKVIGSASSSRSQQQKASLCILFAWVWRRFEDKLVDVVTVPDLSHSLRHRHGLDEQFNIIKKFLAKAHTGRCDLTNNLYNADNHVSM